LFTVKDKSANAQVLVFPGYGEKWVMNVLAKSLSSWPQQERSDQSIGRAPAKALDCPIGFSIMRMIHLVFLRVAFREGIKL
jgi:hypothetical protein